MPDPTFNTLAEYVDWRISQSKAKSRARRDDRPFAVLLITRQMERVKAAHAHLRQEPPRA